MWGVSDVAHEVLIYGLTTCLWCVRTRAWFEAEGVPFHMVNVDALEGDERTAVMAEVQRLSGALRFPVTVIDGVVIVGFGPEDFAARIAGEREA